MKKTVKFLVRLSIFSMLHHQVDLHQFCSKNGHGDKKKPRRLACFYFAPMVYRFI